MKNASRPPEGTAPYKSYPEQEQRKENAETKGATIPFTEQLPRGRGIEAIKGNPEAQGATLPEIAREGGVVREASVKETIPERVSTAQIVEENRRRWNTPPPESE